MSEYQLGDNVYTDEASRYGACMLDIVSRILLIQSYWAEPLNHEVDEFHIEYLCLQFRIIFELVMLSNLVVNRRHYNDVNNKVPWMWRPDKLDELITAINPDYYPVAMVLDETTRRITNTENGYMKKADLLAAFNLCNDYLHAKNPFAPARDYRKVYDSFAGWAIGINKLLVRHIIKFKDPNQLFWVVLPFDTSKRISIQLMKIIS